MREMQLIPAGKCAHRARLTPAGQELYDAMAQAMMRRERTVTVPFRDDGVVTDVFDALLRDQPFLFDLRREKVTIGTCDAFTRVEWDYYLTDAQYAQHRSRIYQALQPLCRRIPKVGRALRREWEIYRVMLRMGVKSSQDDEPDWWCYSIAGPLLYGEAVCEGAALLFYLLCLLEGVPCQVITGRSCGVHHKGCLHAWNLVRLGEQHAHVDVYWDMCLCDDDMKCSYDYFNLPDRQICSDHLWDRALYPAAETDRYSWFTMKRCEVFSAEGFRQTLTEGEKAGITQVMIRFQILPEEAEIRRIARETLFVRRSGSIVWRVNQDQKIVQLAVTYT